MAIQHITVAEVTCQKCPTSILVRNWRDAEKHGWAVPCDGHLQLCPECVRKQREEIFANAPTTRPGCEPQMF